MTQPNPSREVELQRTMIDHVPQLEEEIEEVFSQLDEARAERAGLQRTLEESQRHLVEVGQAAQDRIERLEHAARLQSKLAASQEVKRLALESELAEARAENERLNQRLVHAVIVRDVEFWRNYADETCKNIQDAHAKVLEELIKEGRENESLKSQVEELRAALHGTHERLGVAIRAAEATLEYTEWKACHEAAQPDLEKARKLAQQVCS